MAELTATPAPHAEVGVISMAGLLDRDAEQPMAGAYVAATALDPAAVLLDFSRVTYINSTGIAVVVGVLGRARSEGREVRAAGLTEHYRHIFEITRLSDFITFVPAATPVVDGGLETP